MVEFDLATVLSFITIQSIGMLLLGVAAGVALGAVPGLTGTIGLALALPFTILIDPVPAMALLIGLYKGGMFGGAISAIGFGVPGTPSSAPTVFDGYTMSKKGRPRSALITAHYSGVSADIFSDIVLILSFAPLAILALRFGPREMFALMLVALAVLAVFASQSVGRALIAIGIGLLAGAIGPDPITSRVRLDLGLMLFRGGVPLVPFLVGLFALSEILIQWAGILDRWKIKRPSGIPAPVTGADQEAGDDHITVRQWLGYWRETLLGAVMGTLVGALPGPGATLASFTSYGVASRFKRNRGKFGTGVPEGVAAAEAADSATAGATLIPLFGLGIPGSVMAALFGAALTLQGITPGPGMLRSQGEMLYAFFIVLFIGSILLFFVAHLIIPIYSRLASVKMEVIVPVLTVLSVLGVYAIEVSVGAVMLMIASGLLGFTCRKHAIPIGAVIMAFVIGPLLEANFRRGMLLSGGDWTYWFSSPLTLSLYASALVIIVYLLRGRSAGEQALAGAGSERGQE